MIIERIVENEEGIQDESSVQAYDLMQRGIRDRGYLDEKLNPMLDNGLIHGKALEIGQGPGYYGLEWLKATKDTTLCGIEISQAMIHIANRNAKEYQLTERVNYYHGDAGKMIFEDKTFDLVFSSFSLHEWDDPKSVIKEAGRVLKRGGQLFIIDFRRDIDLEAVSYIPNSVPDPAMREGFFKSVYASYTGEEIKSFFIEQENQLKLELYKENEYGLYFIARKV